MCIRDRIIEDCLYVIEPFMLEVMPEYREDKYYDYSNIEEMANIADEYLQTAWQKLYI